LDAGRKAESSAQGETPVERFNHDAADSVLGSETQEAHHEISGSRLETQALNDFGFYRPGSLGSGNFLSLQGSQAAVKGKGVSMAVATRHRTVVNSAKRKLSRAQIAAGFGGKRRKAAAKSQRKAARKNKSGPQRKAVAHHRPRAAKRAERPNLGKIISFSLPKESTTVATTKRNTAKKSQKAYAHHRPAKQNPSHRRRTRRNPGIGDITHLVTSAVFTIAGAVGTKYITQMVLSTSNTGIMGYFGNLVSAFLLSWGVKAFMKNDAAAAAVLAGGFVQVVLRLIADYTPFGQYTANLGVGDYLAQGFSTPQRIAYKPHSAALMPVVSGGMSGCGGLYGGSSLYAA
jgi:hypothetical protein